MKQLTLQITTSKSHIARYIQPLLEVIFFQRCFGSLRPVLKSQFHQVVYPFIDTENTQANANELVNLTAEIDELIKTIERKVAMMTEGAEGEAKEGEFGEVYLSYYVVKPPSQGSSTREDEDKGVSTWSNFINTDTESSTERQKPPRKSEPTTNIEIFEQFHLQITLIATQSLGEVSKFLENDIMKVIEWCGENKGHIPNLTNLNVLPFDYKLGFVSEWKKDENANDNDNTASEGEEAENDWRGFIKKILK